MNKKLLMGIIAGICVVALVLGLVLGLNNCAGTTDPTAEPTPSGTAEPTDPTEKPTRPPKETEATEAPELGGISYYSGMPDYSWYDEDEIYEYYTLYTADQFMAFVELVNGMGVNFKGVTIKLGANFVFNNGDASKWTRDDAEELLNWTPIGSKATNAFAGTIDGQGFYISGLYSVRGRDNGFILYADKATVQNLAIVNSYLCNTGGNQKDAQVLGTFVARGYGVTLKNLYTDAILEGGGYHTGGIAAFARDTWTLNKVDDAKDVLIDSCVFAGTIKGCVGTNVGGILGGTDGVNVKLISNCLNLGSIESTVGNVGGIAGSLSKETVMTNCVNAGKVVSKVAASDRAALVGSVSGDATVKDCYFANIPGAKPFGSGSPTQSGVLGVARASMKGSNVTKTMSALDFKTTWTAYKDDYAIPTGVINMYDALKKTVEEDTGNGGAIWKNQTGSTDTGKADTSWYKEGETTFTLTTADQLYGLAQLVNEGKTTFKGVTIKLGADIVVNEGDASKWNSETSGLRAWKAIGTSATKGFAGTLDGQGHYISGLYARVDRDSGLICYAMNATVKNLAIVNSYFENFGREHANGYLSAQVLATFVGRAYGTTLQNLYSNARLVIPETAQGFNTGGIAGFAKSNGVQNEVEYGASLIDSCVFAGTITTNNENDDLTGGILGSTDGSYTVIKNCLFRGQINSAGKTIGGIAGKLDKESVMEDCVSVGNVNSKAALIGTVTGTVEVKDCYYVKVTGGKAYGGGTPKTNKVTSLTRDEMKGTNVGTVMTGLDFKSAWTALKDDYPIPTGVKAMYAAHKTAIPGGESDGSTSGGSTGGDSSTTHVPGTPDTTWYEDGKTEFTLTTADQLYGFAQLVNEGTTFQGVTIKLGADIVVNEGDSSTWTKSTTGLRAWTPIGNAVVIGTSWKMINYFSGTLDGQGHYISGLYSVQGRDNGFMTYTVNATIQNLAIINSYFESTGIQPDGTTAIGNGQFLGSFVARGFGVTLKNLYTNAVVVVSDTKDFVTGGIVAGALSNGTKKDGNSTEHAYGAATIDSVIFAGTIKSNTGAGGERVGGILGSTDNSYVTIKNSLFVGTINSNDKYVGGIVGDISQNNDTYASVITDCVSAGIINKEEGKEAGAILGRANDKGSFTVSDCYYSEDLGLELYGAKSGNIVSTNSTGNKELKASQMVSLTVKTDMPGLDFTSAWTAQENDYPVPTGALAMYLAHKEPHEHAWSDAWTSDETHHWHNCGNIGCDVTDPTQKTGYGQHVFDDDKDKDCATCGYVRVIPDANDGATDGSLSKPSGYIGGDNSWYKPDSDITEYTLTNVDQLFGFAYLVNIQGYKFEGITVKLGVNMVINEGDASTWGTTPPALVWHPIGTQTNYFAGTFDGQGHYISGLYTCEQQNNGLFGWTANATIKNVAIVNSYFKTVGRDTLRNNKTYYMSGQMLASFAARAYGTTLKNLYSDATLHYAVSDNHEGDWCTAGIAAIVTSPAAGSTSETQDKIVVTNKGSIENCVFAGTILTGDATATTGAAVGGILGSSNSKPITIKNCLFLGNIVSNDKQVGGIAGILGSGSTLESSVSVGTMAATSADVTVWGAIVGESSGTTSVKNCYYSDAQNLPLYGKKATLNGEDTNTELTNAKMKGLQVNPTTMPNLTFGEGGWTAQEGDYPVPTSMKIMVNHLRVLTADALAPVINTQPTMDNLTVEAESLDGGALTYQWYMSTTSDTEDFAPIDGATSPSYTHQDTVTGNVWYKCEVTNTNNNTTSDVKSAKVESNVVKVHTHVYNYDVMGSNAEGHWNPCSVEGCDADVTSLATWSEHDYTDDTDATCNVEACGYERHLHNWSTWNGDEYYGWKECATANCDVTENSAKEDYHAHAYEVVNGVATCPTCNHKLTVSYYDGTPDKTWYNETDTEFVLYHADQFYGLIELSNTDKYTFAGQTIKLAVNMVIIDGDARTWGTTAPFEKDRYWTPLGSDWANAFSGTLDGQNHYVSGLYNNLDKNLALIYCVNNGTVRNMAIVNSYFEIKAVDETTEVLGSFVGKGRGAHLENLYSDAILVGGYQQVGGIAGFIQSRSDTVERTAHIKNCVFAGSITGSTKLTGGIVGSDNKGGDTLIENCLNLGTISATSGSYVGGIIGKPLNVNTIRYCVGVGAVSSGNAIVGYGNKTDEVAEKKFYIENSYYISENNSRYSGGKHENMTQEVTNVAAIADANAKGEQVTTTMVNLGFPANWTARADDYPVPTGILTLMQNVPVNADAPVLSAGPQSSGYDAAADTVTPLEVTATSPDGGTILYQWFENSTNSNVGGTLIEGATGATYTPSLTGMVAGDAKYYYCVVINVNTNMTGVQAVSLTSEVACVHIHQQSSTLTGHDATHHWYACTVSGCEDEAGKAVHTGDGNTCTTCNFLKANYYNGEEADTKWYVGHESEDTYILNTPAELYGLKNLVNGGTTKFEGKTIKLGANMVFNTGDASTYGTTAPSYSWIPIGDNESSRYFAGTFDGDGHYLSGLYYSIGREGGFFCWTRNATIENLAIINTYFEHKHESNSGQGLATFVDRGDSVTLRNLYTDAILENNAKGTSAKQQSAWCTGGIVAFAYKKNGSKDPMVENCVFAGEIIETAYYAGGNVGGIVGSNDGKNNLTIQNCLFSGKISSNDNQVGGIIGNIGGTGNKVLNCVVVGEINRKIVANTTTYNKFDESTWGAIVGYVGNSSTVIENCYYDYNATDITNVATAFVLPYSGGPEANNVSTKDSNTYVTRDSMKGTNALDGKTALSAWTATDGYPVPTDVVNVIP